MAAMLSYPEKASRILSSLTEDDFVTSFNRRVFTALRKSAEAGAELSFSAISAEFSEEEVSSVARMLARYHDVPVSERDVEEYIKVLKTENAALKARQIAAEQQPEKLLDYLQALRKQKE